MLRWQARRACRNRWQPVARHVPGPPPARRDGSSRDSRMSGGGRTAGAGTPNLRAPQRTSCGALPVLANVHARSVAFFSDVPADVVGGAIGGLERLRLWSGQLLALAILAAIAPL